MIRSYSFIVLSLLLPLIFFKPIYSVASAESIKAHENLYYPLQVGNKWEYETAIFSGEQEQIKRSSIIITKKSEKQGGQIEYYKQDNKLFLLKTDKGIVTPRGTYVLKYPLMDGSEWVSGPDSYDQRYSRVKVLNTPVSIKGNTYEDCIEVVTLSDFHAISRNRSVVYIAFENKEIFCRNTGLVIVENYDIYKETGEKKLVSRSQLVHFSTENVVPSEQIDPQPLKSKKLIEFRDSFRFPTKKFLHPLISPDNKWLVYHRTDTLWKEFYYTEIGKSDEKYVPLPPLKDNCKYDIVGVSKIWSPDGKYLAFSVDTDCDDFIVWLDFSDTKPQIVEILETGRNGVFTWTHTGVFVYLDEFGNIIKKKPGGKPEKVVYFRSSYSQRGGTDNFQVSKNNVVIYRTRIYGNRKRPNYSYSDIYLSSLDESSHSAKKVVSAEYLSRVTVSPNGRFAFLQFNYFNRDGKESGESKIVDLTTGDRIVNLPMIKASAWSPDGNKLAFLEKTLPEKRKDDPSKAVWWNPHFYIYDLITGKTKDYGYGVADKFSWSPIGKHILYSMKYDHPSLGVYKPGIFIMRISDGKDIGRLSKISASGAPYISPSGKYIVWDALNNDTFFIVENPYIKEMGF